jgi:hypothetical protein
LLASFSSAHFYFIWIYFALHGLLINTLILIALLQSNVVTRTQHTSARESAKNTRRDKERSRSTKNSLPSRKQTNHPRDLERTEVGSDACLACLAGTTNPQTPIGSPRKSPERLDPSDDVTQPRASWACGKGEYFWRVGCAVYVEGSGGPESRRGMGRRMDDGRAGWLAVVLVPSARSKTGAGYPVPLTRIAWCHSGSAYGLDWMRRVYCPKIQSERIGSETKKESEG